LEAWLPLDRPREALYYGSTRDLQHIRPVEDPEDHSGRRTASSSSMFLDERQEGRLLRIQVPFNY
jgi:hypothetical protein